MKAKLLVAIIAVFFLYSMVSAQSYSIRVEFNTNLRAEYSLDSHVVESAPAGSILQVVDSVNRWLKINRNGREVWMASWVSHTRVAESGQTETAAQPASNIDNCCFVDRQCHSAQDWENGYWAFQNGQCAAPAQPQPQTPAQPASNVPAQIDNCCFVDRQCNTDAEWAEGYHAFQDNQCAAPAQSQPQTSAQPASNAPAQVDNCCFVDRQCHSEWDWENGFYAFRDNQCPVSTGAQPRAATGAPAPNSSSIMLSTTYMTEGVRRLLADPTSDPFNNCCHMRYQDKDCSGEAEWEAGYWAFQNGHCLAPAPLGTRPSIEGDHPKFTKLVNDALELIRTHAPVWLDYIDLSGTREFRLMPLGGAGGFYNNSWTIGHQWLAYERDDPAWQPDFHYIVGYAGGITHEACHAIQQRTYSQSAGWTNEAACVEAQLAVIEAINPNSRDVPWLRNLIANIQNPEYWWWD